jgi:serine phosphatase RsbU (regulator of sigma subunit)
LYAQKIQKVILPPLDYVSKVLPEAFVIYMPKDIVSGDFYWVTKKHNQINFAAVDCTGHGVPGAFMSLVGNNNLNMAVSSNELKNPAEILDLLNQGVTEVLRQKDDENEIRDGMDIALCSVDIERKTLQFSGAYRPLYLLRDGELTEIKGDKFPIGGSTWNTVKSFTNHIIDIRKGDSVYIFSDGYTDQFGGPHGKKFMPKRLKMMLKKIYKLDKEFQEETIRKAFDDWKGNEEQLDDVMVIGLKF